MDCFKYLGSQVAADGGCERDAVHRMNEGYRAWGALKSVLSNRALGIKAKKCLYERVIVPTALYGAEEAWGMRSPERRKVNVLEMKCLRSLDRVRNEEVRMRAGIEMELASRADQIVLRCFGHVERMDDHRVARRVWMAEVSGGRVRGRPRLGWMDGVKVAVVNRGMTEEAARKWKEWRALVHKPLTRPSLQGPVFFRTSLPCYCVHHMERGGMPLHDAVGINCKKGATTENQGSAVKYMVCVFYLT